MSRVKGVIDRAIMVRLCDVTAGDVLFIRGTEGDPIIERIENNEDLVRLHYKPRSNEIGQTAWLNPKFSQHIFIHDLKNEREGFEGVKVEWPFNK